MKLAEVIIPIYNEEKVLKQQCRILSKFFDNLIGKKKWSFIFVDNGSTDNSKKIIKEIVKLDGKYFFKKNNVYFY